MKTMFWRMPALALTAFALCTAAAIGQESHAGHDHDAGDLGDAMEEIAGAFKKLGRSMRSPDAAHLDDYKAQAAIIKKQALKAKDLVPTLAEEAGDGKAAMVAAYQKSMKKFIDLAGELETTLAKGDLAGAQAAVGKLNEARKQGHKEFKKPDDD